MPRSDRTWLRRTAGVAGIAYVALFVGTFNAGPGEYLYGRNDPAAVATWAAGHASVMHSVVLLYLLGDWLLALFIIGVAVSLGRGLAASTVACAGIVAAETVYAVVRGLQYVLPDVAISAGIAQAQALVILESHMVFAVYPVPFAIGLAGAGWVLLRAAVPARVLGGAGLLIAILFALSFIWRALMPAAGSPENAATLATLVWTLATGAALLLPTRWLVTGRRSLSGPASSCHSHASGTRAPG